MSIMELQDKIDAMNYWDSRILDFQINFFGDEVKVVIEGDGKENFIMKFLLCYKVQYETDAKNRWKGIAIESMSKLQLGYFAHDISIKKSDVEGFIEVNLEIPMIFAKIICKDISIEQVKYNESDYFWSKNA